jgi:hypothetical protein
MSTVLWIDPSYRGWPMQRNSDTDNRLIVDQSIVEC